MRLAQVAAQLYTVREHCTTAAGLARAAENIRAIGYPAVQVSGIGPIPYGEVATILRDAGLAVCATHEPPHEILDAPDACIARLQALGCRTTAYPFPRDIDFTQPEQLRTLARKVAAAGARFRGAGIRLAYHNHAMEFTPFAGDTFLEWLYAHTPAEDLAAELDTYWVHYGGGDVADWCERLEGRLPLLHIKDYTFDPVTGAPTWCEIGHGTLPWKKILAAAERSGCEWFIVEQDTCPGDPFESLRKSFDFIRSHLVSD